MAEARTFESTTAAFEFACEHTDCSLKDGKPVLAVVLALQGRMCSVRIAHPDDKTIPEGTLNELLARTDLNHVCFSAMLADSVTNLKIGDLVLFTTMPELAAVGKPTVAGTIVSRAYPHYTTKSGWQTRVVEPKAPPPADPAPAD